jgi:hypothetical protein
MLSLIRLGDSRRKGNDMQGWLLLLLSTLDELTVLERKLGLTPPKRLD